MFTVFIIILIIIIIAEISSHGGGDSSTYRSDNIKKADDLADKIKKIQESVKTDKEVPKIQIQPQNIETHKEFIGIQTQPINTELHKEFIGIQTQPINAELHKEFIGIQTQPINTELHKEFIGIQTQPINTELHKEFIGIQTSLKNVSNDRPNTKQNLIKSLIEQRNIEHLIHFTKKENLPSILQNGLIPRNLLNTLDIHYIANDPLRLDRRSNSISLSISFPNSLLFYKWRMQDKNAEWVVLLLNPDILWQKKCMFFRTNAANAAMSKQNNEYSQSYESLVSMFEGSERSRFLDTSYTTDIQAEVLCFDKIDPSDIQKVIQQNDYQNSHYFSIRQNSHRDLFSSYDDDENFHLF